jgi:hypothetical protein
MIAAHAAVSGLGAGWRTDPKGPGWMTGPTGIRDTGTAMGAGRRAPGEERTRRLSRDSTFGRVLFLVMIHLLSLP